MVTAIIFGNLKCFEFFEGFFEVVPSIKSVKRMKILRLLNVLIHQRADSSLLFFSNCFFSEIIILRLLRRQ